MGESEKNRKKFQNITFSNKKNMSTEVASNNNRLDGENKIKYEKLKKQLETPIETRINVNFCLLVYWLPAYVIDLSSQFPTFNGTHIFTDFLSNWGQTVILFHLIFSLSMDLSGEDFRKKWKKVSKHYIFEQKNMSTEVAANNNRLDGE